MQEHIHHLIRIIVTNCIVGDAQQLYHVTSIISLHLLHFSYQQLLR
jgi:hypothetical protein